MQRGLAARGSLMFSRRSDCSMPKTVTAMMGKRNSEIAAPFPRYPALTPTWYA